MRVFGRRDVGTLADTTSRASDLQEHGIEEFVACQILTFPAFFYGMVVRIRLARFGKRNAPFYNIVIAQARCARSPLTHGRR